MHPAPETRRDKHDVRMTGLCSEIRKLAQPAWVGWPEPVSAIPKRPARRWILRRLAMVFLVLVTLLMGALGWVLGRPGVLRPEPQVFAAPARARPSQSNETASKGVTPASSTIAPEPHGDARGE